MRTKILFGFSPPKGISLISTVVQVMRHGLWFLHRFSPPKGISLISTRGRNAG